MPGNHQAETEAKQGPRPTLPARTTILVALLLGLLAGLVSVLQRATEGDRMVDNISHPTWHLAMAPAAGLLILGALGLLLAPIPWLLRGRARPALVLFPLAATFWFSVGLDFLPFVRRDALAILALGLGFQTARAASRALARGWLSARRLGGVLTLLVLLIAIGTGLQTLGRNRELERQAAARPASAPATAPNVLLVTLDVLRARNTTLGGYERDTTPNLGRRAGESTIFTSAYAATSWTLPSHASLFTGLEAEATRTSWQKALDDRAPTLAEFLRDRGYDTAGFAANWDYCSWRTGLARGFLHYEDYVVSLPTILACTRLGAYLNRQSARLIPHPAHPYVGRKRAEVLSDDFIAWLDRRDSTRPFFAFLNYIDMHEPYDAPAPWAGRHDHRRPDDPRRRVAAIPGRHDDRLLAAMDRYDDAVAYVDHHLERALAALAERGLLDRTLVVITSDHGHTFNEHDCDGHGNSLYVESLEVPLLVRLPGLVPAGGRVSRPIIIRDLARTILDLAGFGAETPLGGRSLRPLIDGEDEVETSPLRFQLAKGLRPPRRSRNEGGELRAIIEDGYQLILNGDPALGTELYHLQDDPFEQDDLSDEAAQQDRVRRLRAELEATR